MLANCKGCNEELNMLFDYSKQNYYLVQQEITNLGIKGKHLFIMMVNDKGKIIVC